MFFHCLAPRDQVEKLLADLKDEDLSEVNLLLYRMNPIYQALPEACRVDLKSFVAEWIGLTTNLDPKTCQTLLRPAIVSGSIESVEALLSRGADLNSPYGYRNSALMVAIAFLETPDRLKMVKFLVEKGANVNRSHGIYSPLVVATLKQPDVVLYLLQNGAKVNEVGDDLGNTPLTAAVSYDTYDDDECRSITHCRSTVQTLLSAGADPNKSNNKGETALHWAFDAEIASLLIEAGADLEVRNTHGVTPLLVAACTGEEDVINVLSEHGADMAAVDERGDSALHLIADQLDEPKEETLRSFACQCNLINKKGMTPLMLAAKRCHRKTIRILLELGADPNTVAYEYGKPKTALSIVFDGYNRRFDNLPVACAEELIVHSSVTSLSRCCPYFFNMIGGDQRRVVQLMVTRGMAPFCENTQTLERTNNLYVKLSNILDKLSPLAFALVSKNFAIAQYLIENWFLTPADLVGSIEMRHLRSVLEREPQSDGLRFMDENLSQPMSLKKLSFVAVSAQLGGMAGREERVSQTPLPNILKDKLLFRREDFSMDFTDWSPLSTFDVEDSDRESISD
ncbi:ankyrin repeat-containing protein [Plakobranchus ocellatus]|uniref:Ankyrin repeat-containing protein n=1 Tax=Plakobranchus ocellatus TaxID=259542 RepID=A0AAV4DYZ1_9GAST|nr:ankyrin repeat-containing protein [Plakobranchus ocellatus]